MASRQFVAKPLSEPMLACCQLEPQEQTLEIDLKMSSASRPHFVAPIVLRWISDVSAISLFVPGHPLHANRPHTTADGMTRHRFSCTNKMGEFDCVNSCIFRHFPVGMRLILIGDPQREAQSKYCVLSCGELEKYVTWHPKWCPKRGLVRNPDSFLMMPWWKLFPGYWTLCEGIHRSQRTNNAGYNVFFDVGLNKRLNKPSSCRWFKTLWQSLWCHCKDHMTHDHAKISWIW